MQGHHKIKKTHGDRVHKHRREKTVAEKQPSELPKAKKHKSMGSDEDDEEPQTSLEPLETLSLRYQYYLFIKDHQPVRKDQLPMQFLVTKTVSIAMNSVQIQDPERTLRSDW